MHRLEFNLGQYHLAVDFNSCKTHYYKYPLFERSKNEMGNGMYFIIGHFELMLAKKYYKNTSRFFWYI